MNKDELPKTAKELVAKGKGILAADESLPTIKKRFEKIGVESTEATRRAFRELLFTTRGIEEFISGVIMFDETVRQATKKGVPFVKLLTERGIVPGIKVDEGREAFAGSSKEEVTKGLETLSGRLKEYHRLGLKFTKWRGVVVIGKNLPTSQAISENARRLAEYAKVSQEGGFVPIVEPEVLRDGDHDILTCEEATKRTLTSVFSELERKKVNLSGMLLKPNMVTQGKDAPVKASPRKVAEATLRVLGKTVPEGVCGIVFLSGGQTPEEATLNLNEINRLGKETPWQLSFSFARALQQPVLEAWRGKTVNIEVAQKAFLKRARFASAARYNRYTPEMEKEKDE